jgi:hypothetical protein
MNASSGRARAALQPRALAGGDGASTVMSHLGAEHSHGRGLLGFMTNAGARRTLAGVCRELRREVAEFRWPLGAPGGRPRSSAARCSASATANGWAARRSSAAGRARSASSAARARPSSTLTNSTHPSTATCAATTCRTSSTARRTKDGHGRRAPRVGTSNGAAAPLVRVFSIATPT